MFCSKLIRPHRNKIVCLVILVAAVTDIVDTPMCGANRMLTTEMVSPAPALSIEESYACTAIDTQGGGGGGQHATSTNIAGGLFTLRMPFIACFSCNVIMKVIQMEHNDAER